MGIESVNYQCPACGGPLRYDGAKALLVCDHCDSEFTVADIEARYASKQQAAEEIGQNLAAWRKLLGLTAQQVAERAGTTRQTVGRLERGDLGVSLEILLGVSGALGLLDELTKATDPYETAFGRARADQALPKRVRR